MSYPIPEGGPMGWKGRDRRYDTTGGGAADAGVTWGVSQGGGVPYGSDTRTGYYSGYPQPVPLVQPIPMPPVTGTPAPAIDPTTGLPVTTTTTSGIDLSSITGLLSGTIFGLPSWLVIGGAVWFFFLRKGR